MVRSRKDVPVIRGRACIIDMGFGGGNDHRVLTGIEGEEEEEEVVGEPSQMNAKSGK